MFLCRIYIFFLQFSRYPKVLLFYDMNNIDFWLLFRLFSPAPPGICALNPRKNRNANARFLRFTRTEASANYSVSIPRLHLF